MKRTLSMLFVAVVVMLSSLGTASAELAAAGPDAPNGRHVIVHMPTQQNVSTMALSCGSGDFCAWRTYDGSGGRCSWSNADNDWWTAPVTCSWSSSNPVWSVYNNGANASYAGVCMYPVANYGGNEAWWAPRGKPLQGWPVVIIRSHKWVTGGPLNC
ncbi:peptidase inhibitor family I36 protein [Lentzea sp. JNUCC 0626]|uniref:peptidase inhibitor family I36 protein n=1 Tax=Lentzea sp. JNUCC 0626 TaxID=3367513 RepID=UPI00374A02C3